MYFICLRKCEREREIGRVLTKFLQQMGQQVTFNSGSASLEKIVVNSKIDLHRDRRRSEEKQGRGVKWVYGKRGVNGMEGRVKKLNLNPIFAGVELGALSHGCLFWAWACWVFWRTGVRVGEE